MIIKNLIKLKNEKLKKEKLRKSNINHIIKYNSRKYKNIILDMDKTLIEGYFSLKHQKVMIEERPFLGQFLKFVFNHFENVSIWTNANKEWYDHVYNSVLYKYIPDGKIFDFVFTFDDGYVGKDNYGPKDLNIIFDIYKTNGYTKDNTFLVDDSDIHFNQNPQNCYLIKPFEIDLLNNSHKHDIELLKIISFFGK